jgi:hypothetical protein
MGVKNYFCSYKLSIINESDYPKTNQESLEEYDGERRFFVTKSYDIYVRCFM